MIPKFRAWHREEKKMFIVESIDFFAKHEMGGYSKCGGEERGDRPSHITICEFETYRGIGRFDADKLILMQSTGLKDKNGKEIFEGDVVRLYMHSGSVRCIFAVKNLRAYFMDDYHPDDLELYEIIGNIHENPELLEEARKK